MEYRIIESYSASSDDIWYAAERKKKFLFWTYWENLTDSVWRTQTLAEDQIEKAKDRKVRKLKVVKEYNSNYT